MSALCETALLVYSAKRTKICSCAAKQFEALMGMGVIRIKNGTSCMA